MGSPVFLGGGKNQDRSQTPRCTCLVKFQNVCQPIKCKFSATRNWTLHICLHGPMRGCSEKKVRGSRIGKKILALLKGFGPPVYLQPEPACALVLAQIEKPLASTDVVPLKRQLSRGCAVNDQSFKREPQRDLLIVMSQKKAKQTTPKQATCVKFSMFRLYLAWECCTLCSQVSIIHAVWLDWFYFNPQGGGTEAAKHRAQS